jgi:Holliday junction DNA helicase RuvA
MIVRIHGKLESVADGRAVVALADGMTYEVLIPSFLGSRLGPVIGEPVTFHTVHYLEGSSQGANLTPRLAGFTREGDRAFFELFTSVKGIGARKALRAMTLSTEQIAAAVADRDTKLLQSLPEIGKRMAETIVASLHGKVDRFLSEAAYGEDRPTAEGEAAPAAAGGRRAVAREALEVLLQLGENRADAVQWIDRVLASDEEIDSADEVISEVLRLKSTM